VAIDPASDIVLGVTLAADPEKYRAAVERLQRLGATAGPASSSWHPTVAAARDDTSARPAAAPAIRAAVSPPRQLRGKPDAFAQLEAFVLQRFIQSMLPKNAARVYGKGTAGEIWKSMLAEKLGAELAGSGQVGIARRLEAAVAAASLAAATGNAPTPPPPRPPAADGAET
jgi:hypothetical protein